MKIKDVARLASVSVATISRVLNDDPNVKPETREHVKEVILQCGYKPNIIGRNLRTARSNRILVIMPTASQPFYTRILEGIEERAEECGYTVLLGATNFSTELERKYINMLLTKQVDGAISLMSMLPMDELTSFAAQRPLVQCGAYTLGADLSYVTIDQRQAAYEAVSYLISKGHRKIAYIVRGLEASFVVLRTEGYTQALTDAGIAYRQEYVIKPPTNEYYEGIPAGELLFSLADPPTAVFTNDSYAVGLIKYMTKIGIRAGIDVDVLGFDNWNISEFVIPSLSTVAQPRYEFGKISMDLLQKKIEDLHCENEKIYLPYELLLRDSTARKSDNKGNQVSWHRSNGSHDE